MLLRVEVKNQRLSRLSTHRRQAEPVENDRMRVIEDITYELIVHSEPIVELPCLECSVAELCSHVRFYGLYCSLECAAPQMVSDDEKVDPTIRILYENASRKHELETASRIEPPQEFIFLHEARVDEKPLELRKVRERLIERPPPDALPSEAVVLSILPEDALHESLAFDETYLSEHRKLVTCGSERALGARGNVLVRIRRLGIKEEQAHDAHLGFRAEEFA